MSHRPAQTPCLGARVSALADGTLRADVRDRALAHTLSCPACRDALDVERLTIERLRSLDTPAPSAALMATLYSLGETGGPVPPRRGFGPGMPRPLLVSVGPAGPPSMVAPVRPGGSTHPGNRGAGRRVRRSVVAVAAGALSVGAVTAGVLTAAVGVSPAATRTPVTQFTVQSTTPVGAARTAGFGSSRQASFRTSSSPLSAFSTSAFTTSSATGPLSTSAFSTLAYRSADGTDPLPRGYLRSH